MEQKCVNYKVWTILFSVITVDCCLENIRFYWLLLEWITEHAEANAFLLETTVRYPRDTISEITCINQSWICTLGTDKFSTKWRSLPHHRIFKIDGSDGRKFQTHGVTTCFSLTKTITNDCLVTCNTWSCTYARRKHYTKLCSPQVYQRIHWSELFCNSQANFHSVGSSNHKTKILIALHKWFGSLKPVSKQCKSLLPTVQRDSTSCDADTENYSTKWPSAISKHVMWAASENVYCYSLALQLTDERD